MHGGNPYLAMMTGASHPKMNDGGDKYVYSAGQYSSGGKSDKYVYSLMAGEEKKKT